MEHCQPLLLFLPGLLCRPGRAAVWLCATGHATLQPHVCITFTNVDLARNCKCSPKAKYSVALLPFCRKNCVPEENVQSRYERVSKPFIWGLAAFGILIEVCYTHAMFSLAWGQWRSLYTTMVSVMKWRCNNNAHLSAYCVSVCTVVSDQCHKEEISNGSYELFWLVHLCICCTCDCWPHRLRTQNGESHLL